MPTTSPDRRAMRLFAACLVVASSLSCYTLFDHPRVASLDYRRPPSTQPCTRCHSGEELWRFIRPPRFTGESTPWSGTAHPWWFDTRARADSAGGHRESER